MRIILVQAEIELAIRAYVLTQISVKDGQEVTIDFKNTRGEDGATAEINITSPLLAFVGNGQRATQTTQSAPKETKASAAPAAAPTAATTAPVEQPAPAASISSGEERIDPAVNQEEEAPAIQAAEEETAPVVEAEPEAEPEAVTKPVATDDAPPVPKSLFANLTKPVNPKT